MSACFLEMHKSALDYTDSWEKRKERVVDQGYFFILDEVIDNLSKKMKSYFPTLVKIQKGSKFYAAEALNLHQDDLNALSNELERISRILNFEEFIPGIKNQSFRDLFLNFRTLEKLNTEIHQLTQFVNLAKNENYWIRITR